MTAEAAVMVRFHRDGRVEILLLHAARPRELPRRLRRLAATIVENPSLVDELAEAAA